MYVTSMPLFEYTCRACGHRFEALLAPAGPDCPHCASPNLEKQFSTFGTRSGGTAAAASSSRFT